MLKYPFLWLIRLYQMTLSPDHGPLRRLFPRGFCAYEPSCSQFMYAAVDNLGIFRGGVHGLWRIVRCNPWCKGGADPVPVKK